MNQMLTDGEREKRTRTKSTKKKRWTWKKQKDKPKRPLSAYNLFFQEERRRMMTRNGILGSLIIIIGDRWSDLSDEEREPYYNRAKILKEQYLVDLQKWLLSVQVRKVNTDHTSSPAARSQDTRAKRFSTNDESEKAVVEFEQQYAAMKATKDLATACDVDSRNDEVFSHRMYGETQLYSMAKNHLSLPIKQQYNHTNQTTIFHHSRTCPDCLAITTDPNFCQICRCKMMLYLSTSAFHGTIDDPKLKSIAEKYNQRVHLLDSLNYCYHQTESHTMLQPALQPDIDESCDNSCCCISFQPRIVSPCKSVVRETRTLPIEQGYSSSFDEESPAQFSLRSVGVGSPGQYNSKHKISTSPVKVLNLPSQAMETNHCQVSRVSIGSEVAEEMTNLQDCHHLDNDSMNTTCAGHKYGNTNFATLNADTVEDDCSCSSSASLCTYTEEQRYYVPMEDDQSVLVPIADPLIWKGSKKKDKILNSFKRYQYLFDD